VTRCAPRIDSRLVAALAALDDRCAPIAETHRSLGVLAWALDLPRPSYQATRLLVHALRAGDDRRIGAGEILLDLAYRVRPPDAALELLLPAEERSPTRRPRAR
jgi:hypothetical protein